MTLSRIATRFFWPEQRRQVEVLFDAILPGSPDSPGASDVGCADMLDRLLGEEPPSYYEVPAWRRLYREGLPAVDAACRQRYTTSLADTPADRVTALVTDLASGAVAEIPAAIDQRRLFGALRAHCIEGCFADPRWGGNRGGAMWRWYGYLGPSEPFQRKSQP